MRTPEPDPLRFGLFFERFLKGTNQHLTIVGATSGDTGSAAIDAVADHLAAHSPLEPGSMDRIRRIDAVRPPPSRP